MPARSLELHVRIEGFERIDYYKKPIRKQLQQQGAEVRKIARQLVSAKGGSEPGDYPGRQSGLLRRSVKSKVLRGALAVVVEPERKVLQSKRSSRDSAYPWILAAGTPSIAKRGDYVQEALDRRAAAATSALHETLLSCLVPRK